MHERELVRTKAVYFSASLKLLLSTGNARLVDSAAVDSPVNYLWGEVNGVGKNMLGTLLMVVRDELRAAAAPSRGRQVGRPATTALAAV